MSLVVCQCGNSLPLTAELAGETVACPKCQHPLAVPFAAQPAAMTPGKPSLQGDPAFERDVFLLRQKHLALNEKYVVWDEKAQPILFIERPTHLLRGVGAALAAVVAAAVTGVGFGLLASIMPNEPLQLIFGLMAAVGAAPAFVTVFVLLKPKRHVTFYQDETRKVRLLQVLQDQKAVLFVATFTVNDAAGNLLARLKKNYLYNLFRKQWDCYAPDGTLLCVAKEDDLALAILRRFIGPLLGLLRTNFIILQRGVQVGEFNRKFTILDRYALDLRGDPYRTLDRRIALAIGVMLDTGEKR